MSRRRSGADPVLELHPRYISLKKNTMVDVIFNFYIFQLSKNTHPKGAPVSYAIDGLNNNQNHPTIKWKIHSPNVILLVLKLVKFCLPWQLTCYV